VRLFVCYVSLKKFCTENQKDTFDIKYFYHQVTHQLLLIIIIIIIAPFTKYLKNIGTSREAKEIIEHLNIISAKKYFYA